MVMKTSLQIKMGQQLTMTPQLQQAIRLLQLSTLDLQQEIQQALESNPMLELQEEDDNIPGETNREANERQTTESLASAGDDADAFEDKWNEDHLPQDLPVDTAWDDVYQNAGPASYGSEEDETPFEARNSRTETLQDQLLWQLNLATMSDIDRSIALALIDAVDQRGYLSLALEDIHESLQLSLPEIELDEVQAVLKRIQQFDPPGVACRDLQECLCLQLDQLPANTPWLPQARLILRHYLYLLGNRDYAQLMRRTRLKEDDLRHVLDLIKTLNPHPGDTLSSDDVEYVVPDVIVRKKDNRWQVELNPDIAPRLRVNSHYASMVRRADSSNDNTYMRDQLQEARWFIKSLQSRNETLLKVATRIVQIQQGFLEYGEEAMKPLVLHDIAEAVEMHESTISRVTTQKYLHTPRGIFELKYFFSSHVGTDSGGECSSTAIRAIIKKLIAEESPKKPLSDNKIAALLGEQGIQVARRTIAKYREALSIPPSNERKRLF